MGSQDAAAALAAVANRPAVVTIDLHRGHLDPSVATLPLPADLAAALVERTVPLLDEYRALGIPVIHIVTSYRNREEILSNRFWRFQANRPGSSRAAIAEHNLEGLPGLELMPGIHRPGDAVVNVFYVRDTEALGRPGREFAQHQSPNPLLADRDASVNIVAARVSVEHRQRCVPPGPVARPDRISPACRSLRSRRGLVT